MTIKDTERRLLILAPVYNDWESAKLLLRLLDPPLSDQPFRPHVLFVDDCSSSAAPADFATETAQNLVSIEILRLRRNLGHQRAIAIGLSFTAAERPCEAVLVIDADGEDKPEDVPRLIGKFLEEKGEKVVFAARVRRSEDLLFRTGYVLYRGIHWLLTGIKVQIGNFSMIPAIYLDTLVVVSETWNHYAASVLKSRIPYVMLRTSRGTRLAGRSSMNYVSLVLHGLSGISVFAEIVGVRIILSAWPALEV